ncbi:hypothetical protein NPIL_101041 [Nephila pilipes]|uniref:Uncharacterized protein n=1 Tax=Nephila pilipes TaxID=299642 RepID=A0A8X6R1U4_NEPPI|nr:hypothetical protein NPIL_101041 [Nephila pilipes]
MCDSVMKSAVRRQTKSIYIHPPKSHFKGILAGRLRHPSGHDRKRREALGRTFVFHATKPVWEQKQKRRNLMQQVSSRKPVSLVESREFKVDKSHFARRKG